MATRAWQLSDKTRHTRMHMQVTLGQPGFRMNSRSLLMPVRAGALVSAAAGRSGNRGTRAAAETGAPARTGIRSERLSILKAGLDKCELHMHARVSCQTAARIVRRCVRTACSPCHCLAQASRVKAAAADPDRHASGAPPGCADWRPPAARGVPARAGGDPGAACGRECAR